MSDAEKRIEEALAYIDRAVWASNAEAVGRLHSILQPPPKVHVFDGVPFVTTGEHRHAERGEWYMIYGLGCEDGVGYTVSKTLAPVDILRYAPEEQSS